MRVARADAAPHSKWRSQLERATRNLLFRLNGLRPLSLRRTVLAPGPAPDQLLRLDGRDSIANRLCVRGLARQLLHLQPTRAAGQLPDPAEAAQGRTGEALRTHGRAGRRIFEREATLRSLQRDGFGRICQNKCQIGPQLYSELSTGPRPRA